MNIYSYRTDVFREITFWNHYVCTLGIEPMTSVLLIFDDNIHTKAVLRSIAMTCNIPKYHSTTSLQHTELNYQKR